VLPPEPPFSLSLYKRIFDFTLKLAHPGNWCGGYAKPGLKAQSISTRNISAQKEIAGSQL
jgi:hypothetical protein